MTSHSSPIGELQVSERSYLKYTSWTASEVLRPLPKYIKEHVSVFHGLYSLSVPHLGLTLANSARDLEVVFLIGK